MTENDWILDDPKWAKVLAAWRDLKEGSAGLNTELAANAILAVAEFTGRSYAEGACGEYCSSGKEPCTDENCAVKGFEEILDALRQLGSRT